MRNKTDKGYHRLLIWQKAREFVIQVYKITENFPLGEEFGLKSQLRRASVSIVLNIVEGYRRGTQKELIHFINITTGSLAEVEAALELTLDLKFLQSNTYEEIENKRGELAYLLSSFQKSLRK